MVTNDGIRICWPVTNKQTTMAGDQHKNSRMEEHKSDSTKYFVGSSSHKNPKMAVFGQTPATTQSLQLDLAAGLLGLQPHQSTYSDTD